MTSISKANGVASAGMTAAAQILVIEDEAGIADEIVRELSDRGHRVTHVAGGLRGLQLAHDASFDLLIVDRLLPEMDGLLLIETLRREGVRTPVLMLSALSSVQERVRGLEAGSDDYLSKPFALVELGARVKALLRRPARSRETVLRIGPLELDLIERRARRKAREIELLPREFKLLEYLMRRPSTVVTRDMLLEEVWNYGFAPQTNLVDVHIGKLRRKVDSEGEMPLIHNIRGVGFVLRAPD